MNLTFSGLLLYCRVAHPAPSKCMTPLLLIAMIVRLFVAVVVVLLFSPAAATCAAMA